MKKSLKKISVSLFRLACLALAVVLILVIPTLPSAVNDNLDRIYGSFVGEKSSYLGMIEIWNIDTFESGSTSKTSILNTVAKAFQQKNKGVYVMVRNVTEKECENMLAQGQKPDLFSCSYGVSEKIKPYLQSVDSLEVNLYSNFVEAGKDSSGELYGVAWCTGLYFLISTKESLIKAGVTEFDNFSLLENAYNMGYIKSGKNPKNVYSLSLASKGYLMPQTALMSYNESEASLISELSINKAKSVSQYEAYIDFLVGESVMLLGSQRDVVRISNREQNGKISDVLIEPVLSYSDLVQFMFFAKTEDTVKVSYIKKFVQFLLSENMQKSLAGANMFSPVRDINLEYKITEFQALNNEDIEQLKLKKVF